MGELWLNGRNYSGGGVEVTGEASGAIATFEDGSANPLKSLVVDINPVQAGSGTPSPSNPRAISGWSSVEVTVADDTTDPTTEETYEISLGQTVYGGKLNVTTGELTVTNACDVVKNLTVAQAYTVGTKSVGKLYNLSNTSTSCEANQYHGAISNIAKELPAYFGALRVNEPLPSNIGTFAISTNGIRVAVYDEDITMTETDFTSKYEDMQVCYPLATPTTVTLTPTQISSLLGANNIWADSGDSDVVYVRDIDKAFNILWYAVMNSNSGTRSLNLMKVSEETKEEEEPIQEEPTEEEGNDENQR